MACCQDTTLVDEIQVPEYELYQYVMYRNPNREWIPAQVTGVSMDKPEVLYTLDCAQDVTEEHLKPVAHASDSTMSEIIELKKALADGIMEYNENVQAENEGMENEIHMANEDRLKRLEEIQELKNRLAKLNADYEMALRMNDELNFEKLQRAKAEHNLALQRLHDELSRLTCNPT